MEEQIIQYFEKEKMILLSESPNLKWKEAQKEVPQLTKGWFELSRLEPSIRLEFIRDYWFNALPYTPSFCTFIDRFFAKVKDVGMVAATSGIFLTYSLIGRSDFFLGGPPLIDDEIDALKGQIDFPIPEDFLKFFRIHNGFFKGGDTGIFSSGVFVKEAQRFKELKVPLRLGNKKVAPDLLLPFYRSFGLDVYQCFYSDWYPDRGIGNVLCSLSEGTISDYRIREKGRDYLAFSSFLDWLIFYMEEVK